MAIVKAFREAIMIGFVMLSVTANAFTSSVGAYFNHNSSNRYREPYRHLTRAGDDFETILVRNIESAKSSLWIAVQEIRLPLVAKAIVERRRAGVDVRLVIENSYNYDLMEIQQQNFDKKQGYHGERNHEYVKFVDTNSDGKISPAEASERDAVYILKQAGVKIIDDGADGSAGSDLMHHKFMIIDGKSLVVTSANFTMSDVHGDFSKPETTGNANSLLEFRSEELAKIFAEEFLILWGDRGQAPRFGVKKPYRAPKTVTLDSGERVTVQFSGTSRKLGVEESTVGLILRSLKPATRSVQMALFVFSESEFSDALQQLHADKSVDVRALIEPTFAYRYYSKALDMWGLQLLPQNCRPAPGSNPWATPISTVGVPNVVKGDFLHHKFAVIDGRTTIVGSHNWSRAAAEGNDETLLVIDSPAIGEAYGQEFSRWYGDARLGAPAWLVKQAADSQTRCGN